MTIFNSFREGFVGSFRLAAAIVIAIVVVASAFVNQGLPNGAERAGDHNSRFT